ncbi:hypothetical protein AF38_04648 [Klebsiella pneumoniae MGH 52]|jgi:hypothetical protein|nr:hypothetical protein AF38_04648 [Klebsiella pneumoniae MGH 52]KMI23960.1 hypothetical protein SM87_05744 [Klebsiella pneumoniae]
MNVYYDYDIESVFNWVKEHFILKHSASLVNSPWYDYDIEIEALLNKSNFC